MRIKLIFIIICVLLLGGFFRFWQIENVPPGLNIDEASEGYNAYSILKTGKDRYGMDFPIIFKSFGSYQPPIYTYLAVISTFFFGSSIFSVKLVSIVSGLVVILFTFLIIREFFKTKGDSLALLAGLTLAISPWAIFFSRIATEASPALAIFLVGFYLCLKSIGKPRLFPLACLFIGIATHAYYSERIISLLFLLAFVWFNRKKLLNKSRWFVIGLILFGVTQIPHLAIIKSGAFTRRLEQVSYLDKAAFTVNGGDFRSLPMGRYLFIMREFSSQYAEYFSPRSLFFDSDDQDARSMPNLSVFYSWMIIPYIVGLYYLAKFTKSLLTKNLLLLLLVAPIPAALTSDPFYTLRVLVLLWVISVVISIGAWWLIQNIENKFIRYFVLSIFFVISVYNFWTNYFILYKFERSHTVGYPDRELVEITKRQSDRNFVVDLSREVSTGIKFAFYRQYDPLSYQAESRQFLEKYYTSVDYERMYRIDNVEIRPIDWHKDSYVDQLIVGDPLAISPDQVKEHVLNLEFELKDLAGEVSFRGYSTNPHEKCIRSRMMNVYCKKWL